MSDARDLIPSPEELRARVRAYDCAVALEHLIHRTVNGLNTEESRNKFMEAAWPLFAAHPAAGTPEGGTK